MLGDTSMLEVVVSYYKTPLATSQSEETKQQIKEKEIC